MVCEAANWQEDINASVAEYNDWYLTFTIDAYRRATIVASRIVEKTLTTTDNLRELNATILWNNPEIIQGLRMTSSPPWAVDRLIGISGVTPGLIKAMEENKTGKRKEDKEKPQLEAVIATIINRYYPEIFPWLEGERQPTAGELERAKQTMIDRLALSIANPDIRNAQEARQLEALETWLTEREYQKDEDADTPYDNMAPGTYRIHVNARGKTENDTNVTIQVDIVIMPGDAKAGDLPILVECKSAGDFTNVNKRRKEEADKHSNLAREHGPSLRYVLYLSGYFDAKYLKYERDAGIMWVWHHRIDDLGKIGL